MRSTGRLQLWARSGVSFSCALLLAALLPAAAWAVELTGVDEDFDNKRLRIVFRFSDAVTYEDVFHYANNFVALKVGSLRFSRGQLRNAEKKYGDDKTECLRLLRYTQSDKYGEIRFVLSKQRTPGDVQIIPAEQSIAVEIIRPHPSSEVGDAARIDAGEPAADNSESGLRPDSGSALPGAEPEADTPESDGFIPDAEPAAEPDWPEPEPQADNSPEDPAPVEGGTDYSGLDTLRGDAPLESASAPDPLPADEPPAVEQPEPLASEKSAPPEPEPEPEDASAQPDAAPLPSPRYKRFDLDSIPAAAVELANRPLNELIMRLVADSGLNVVVDNDVSEVSVTLSFTREQLSLKRALDLLCMVYGLEYSLEDDALVVSAK